MNSSAYYLEEVLEQLIHRTLDEQRELKRKQLFSVLRIRKVADYLGSDKGILAVRYIVIGKLFKAAASMGIFEALPKGLQEHITPLTLVEDLKKGYVKRILRLRKAFGETHNSIEYGDIDLKSLFEELITEAQTVKKHVQNKFDDGKCLGYYFCISTLYNQIVNFIPELFQALPQELRDFNPDSI